MATKSDNLDSKMTDKQRALEKAMKDITKKFGAGAIMSMGEKPNQNVEVTSTGILSLDDALGVGGLPKGRIIEIYGPESSGKTTIALQAAAEVQKNGGTVAYIDAENAMDPIYARNLGVDIDSLLLSQPDTGEVGMEIADALVGSSAVDLIVVDSVAALVPKAEIEGEMGDSHVGLQARLMSQALRKIAGRVHQNQVTVIFINQLREKIGVMFGNPETTPGGRALKFYASVRIEVRRSTQIKEGDKVIGNETHIKIVKNKVAPPFKKISTVMSYGHGIDKYGDMLNLAIRDDIDVVKKSGSWYSYNDERLGQGANNTARYLESHPDLADEIEAKVREKIMPSSAPEESDGAEEEAVTTDLKLDD